MRRVLLAGLVLIGLPATFAALDWLLILRVDAQRVPILIVHVATLLAVGAVVWQAARRLAARRPALWVVAAVVSAPIYFVGVALVFLALADSSLNTCPNGRIYC